MNNFFSIPRFLLLFRKTVMERPMQLLGSIGLMLAGSLIIYTVFAEFIFIGAAQNLAFMWGLFGGGSFISSLVFGYFSSNAMGSSYLTLPASAFEKWLCGVLLVGVIYPVIFCLFFRGVDVVFIHFYHAGLDSKASDYRVKYDQFYIFGFDRSVARQSLYFFFSCAGAMLTGSLFFNKAAFIKVAFIIVGVCIGLFFVHYLFARLLFPNVRDSFPFQGVQITVGKDNASLNLSEQVRSVLTGAVYLLFATLWTLPLVRLKEKEF